MNGADGTADGLRGRRVAVLGGGLAGLTAALDAAAAGAQVQLFEAKPRLGGLTHSFTRGDLVVDNGQHVFLRCCTRYRALLDRLGVADQVHLQPRLDVEIRRPGVARPARLRRNNLPAPLHLGNSLLGYAPLSPPARVRAVLAAVALSRVDVADPATDRRSFGDWLAAHGQDPGAVAALWDLVGVATLNARAADASLALAAYVFQQGLLTDRRAGDIGWSRVPLQQLHGDAAERALLAAGATVTTGTKVCGLQQQESGWSITVRAGTEPESEVAADAVVVALPPKATEALLPDGAVGPAAGWAQRLGTVPIVNVHLRYDRPVIGSDFVAGLDSPVQWIFDRSRAAGAPAGRYVAISLSAAQEFVDLPTGQMRELFVPAVAALLPAAVGAVVEDFFVTREREATFAPAPGVRANRPGAATALPGLVLAGAHTDTGWPATMEGAVRSGEAAIAALLRSAVPVTATRPVARTGEPA
ncbi:MAG TPA: hydroxysqualene dehydroxylase HpnE [Sporichthyaceae bacterium]|nr:hydroxysqualene dehydroxylase HpnE [Sporichthyaceae bacterium]